MKTTHVLALFTLALPTTTILRITAASDLPYQANPALADYPTVFTENHDGFIDTGACSKEALSTNNPVVPVKTLTIEPHWHAVNLHLNHFEVGKWGVCNQCVILQAAETNKQIMAVVAGDCPYCDENEITLTPGAYKAVNEGTPLVVNGVESIPAGFFRMIPCPKTNEELAQWAHDLGIPVVALRDSLAQ